VRWSDVNRVFPKICFVVLMVFFLEIQVSNPLEKMTYHLRDKRLGNLKARQLAGA
jgi:hypothetical protein